jgi:hypothetical protein
VSDPEALATLGRVAESTKYSNRLLSTMSTETQRQLETLTKETRKLVLNDPRMDADEVSTVVDRIKQNPDVAGLVQAGLVRPEQLKDEAYVLSLKSALANRKDDGRPASLRGRVRRSAALITGIRGLMPVITAKQVQKGSQQRLCPLREQGTLT